MTDTNEVRIETSTACNYSCEFCPHSTSFKTNERRGHIMSYSLFKFLLDKVSAEAPHVTELTISGFGEAFLDKNIVEKIRYGKLSGYNIHILTNGSKLNEDIIDELYEIGVSDIRVSVHGSSLHTYQQITNCREEDFYNVEKTLMYATSIKNRTTQIIMTMDVVHTNEHEVQDVINKWSSRVDLLEIWRVHNWADWGSYRQGSQIKSTCGRPFHGPIQIQVDGTINMCCFDYAGQLLLGDFTKQSLKEIYSDASPMYSEIYKHHSEGTVPQSNLLCAHCDQLRESKDVMLYNSKFDVSQRVGKLSTTYQDMSD